VTGGGSDVGISAVEENNALLVRASPAQWESIRRAIDRIDVMPAQVHIEAQVLEVSLTGNLSYGVSWFFDNAVPADLRGIASARRSLGSHAGSIAPPTGGGPAALSWSFLGRDAQAVVSALDAVSDVRVLSTPSLFVRNNAEATLSVGQNVPVASTSFNPGIGNPGTGDNVISNVQYIETGTKLVVRPRISANGMVFMEIEQEISTPGDAGVGGNPEVNSRNLQTEAMVRDGETVMLAGLIIDDRIVGRSGLPGLARVPVLGGLFGRQSEGSNRSEVVVLITPRVVRNPEEARRFTDEYGERFRALRPLPAERDAPR
jgi:general secretion pathway protein D